MKDTKVTKKDMFNGIIATLTENFGDEVQEYVEFLNGEVAALDARAAKEKERRAAKKAEGDELKDAVAAAIGEEPKTGDDIAAELIADFPEVTKAKVTNRASQLVKDGIVFKVQVNVDGRKVVGYTTVEPDAE